MTASQNPPALLKKNQRLLKWVIAAAVILLLVLLVYAFRAPILRGVAQGLIVNDEPTTSDIIFVLNSDYNIRPACAAALYKQGLGPLIVMARSEDTPAVEMGLIPNDTDISVGVLEHLGIPAEKILVLPYPGGVTSTFDEATVLHQYIQSTGIDRIILVTSAFHSRRASWIFARELADLPVDVRMVAVPYSTFDDTNWWQNESGLITLNNEYIKLAYYFLKYR
jgi:uncharacterized SAM-binding protein YcdF (DUF218 family)